MTTALLLPPPSSTAVATAAPSRAAHWVAATCKPRAVHLALVNRDSEPARFHVDAIIASRYTQLWKERGRHRLVPAGSTTTVTFRPSKTDGYVYAAVVADGDTVLDTSQHTDAIACDGRR